MCVWSFPRETGHTLSSVCKGTIMQCNKSQKEVTLEGKLQKRVEEIEERLPSKDDLPRRVMNELLENEEIKAIQDYANTVSITRLGLNDHGPVHMKTVCKNAMKMLGILYDSGVETSLQKEHSGTFADSVVAVMLAAFLHDTGMTIGRKDHELYSGIMAFSVINRILEECLPSPKDIGRRVAIRSMAMEGILGHMGSRKIHSLEAGLILIADGCDMTKGRARIPMEINTKPMVGDIHKYSANSIETVRISKGEDKPIKIEVTMSSDVGFFQIEEVLIPKINASPAKNLVELYAGVIDQEPKKYL